MSSASSSTSARRPKIEEIDIVRAVAILAVVMIHSTSDATLIPTRGSMSKMFFYLLNQAVLNQFAIFSFLFVSGLVLFYGYYDRWDASKALTFYRRRIVSAVIPLVLWSFFYYLFGQWLANQAPHIHWGEFFPLLKWGEAKYHLYFMVIVLQFYLLFPLLMGLAKSAKWALIPFGVVVQVAYFVIGNGYEDRFAHAFQGWWFLDLNEKSCNVTGNLGLLMIGAYMGIGYAGFRTWIRKWWTLMLVLAVAADGLYVAMFRHNVYTGYEFPYPWLYSLHYLFALAISLALLGCGIFLLRRPRLAAPFVSLGRCSFGVYLCHPLFLNLFGRYTHVPVLVYKYDLYVLVGFVFTLTCSWLATLAYRGGMRWFRSALDRLRRSGQAYS